MVEQTDDQTSMVLPPHEILIQSHDIFYEVQRMNTKEYREQSSCVFLKCFNNYVKSVLIG